jgi:hypothetical protein
MVSIPLASPDCLRKFQNAARSIDRMNRSLCVSMPTCYYFSGVFFCDDREEFRRRHVETITIDHNLRTAAQPIEDGIAHPRHHLVGTL